MTPHFLNWPCLGFGMPPSQEFDLDTAITHESMDGAHGVV